MLREPWALTMRLHGLQPDMSKTCQFSQLALAVHLMTLLLLLDLRGSSICANYAMYCGGPASKMSF